MPVFEDEFVYCMIAYDALCVLPPKIRDLADATRWDEATKKTFMFSSTNRAKNPRIHLSLNPLLEESLLRPMRTETTVEAHLFNLTVRRGQLVRKSIEACRQCKESLHAFMEGSSGFEAALGSMGLLGHRIIDLWNPFNLVEGVNLAPVAQRFMENVKVNILQLPFLWGHIGSDDASYLNATPYLDDMSTIVEAERRYEKYFEPIANAFVAGNGFPAARSTIEGWYNAMVNALARVWLYCC
jgi:hypothetical protein